MSRNLGYERDMRVVASSATGTRFVSPPVSALDQLRQPLTSGERRVLDFLLAHFTDWEIYIQPHLNGLRPDFVLLHPKKGIAVFEVKDWDLSALEYRFVSRAGRAPVLMGHKGGEQFSLRRENPVERVRAYKEEIFGLYCPRLERSVGFGVITAGIIFPFAKTKDVVALLSPARTFYQHAAAANIDLYPVVGGDALDSGEVDAIFPRAPRRDLRMSEDLAHDLRNWLIEPDVAAEQRIPLTHELSKQQLTLIGGRTTSGFRRIRGPAGAGKSVVLAARATKLAADGKRVLIAIFNITLINYLLDFAVRFANTGRVRDQLVALNFHHWCKRVALQTGNISEYDALWQEKDPTDHESILAETLAMATKGWLVDLRDDEKFDAILVDEGQDFRLEWWNTLRGALKANGEMVLAADRSQDIYGIATGWTDEAMTGAGFSGGAWSELAISYRLPPSLCKIAKTYIQLFMPGAENQAPEHPQEELDYHTVLSWVQVSQDRAAEQCYLALMEILKATARDAVAVADLTCIVENADIGLAIVKMLSDNGIRSIHTFGVDQPETRRKKLAFFKGDARVKVTTLHSFKGWESRALVVQVNRAAGHDSRALFYSGMTRLKKCDNGCYLTVVSSASELESFGATWPYFRRVD